MELCLSTFFLWRLRKSSQILIKDSSKSLVKDKADLLRYNWLLELFFLNDCMAVGAERYVDKMIIAKLMPHYLWFTIIVGLN